MDLIEVTMLDHVIKILEQSVERHGSLPLTTPHLLNILRMAERREYEESVNEDQYEPF